MKKIIFLVFVVMMVGQFFGITKLALAQSCGDGGACKFSSAGPVDCGGGFEKIGFNENTECPPPNRVEVIQVACCKAIAPSGSTGNTINFGNPLAFDTVEGLLSSVMGTFQGIVVILALIFFIWGAIVYITSAGSDERVKSAKNAMTASLIGLALAIAAPSILKTISTVLKWNKESAALAGAPSAAEIGLNVLEFLLGMVGTLGLIMLIIGGIMYFGSAADEKNVESAKKTIKYAIMGIALALASMVIVRQIAALLT